MQAENKVMGRFLFLRREPKEGAPALSDPAVREVESLFAAAQSAIAHGDLAKAESLCRETLACQAGHTPSMLLLGTIEARTGRLREGIGTLQQLLKTDPESFEALNWLAALQREDHRYEESTQACQRALRLRPEDAETWNNLALSYFAWGHFAQAASSFRRAAGLNPLNPSYHCNLGAALERQERPTEAERAYREGLELNPGNAHLNSKVGQSMLRRGQTREAVDYCRMALASEPESPSRHFQLAQALAANEQLEEAEIHANRALVSDPTMAMAHALLGVILQHYGKFEEANLHLKHAMSLEPWEVTHCYEWVRRNKVADADRELVTHMESMLAQSHREWEDIKLLSYALGKAYDDLGEYGRAITHYDVANKLMVDHVLADRTFNKQRFAAKFDRQIATYSKHFIERNKDWGSTSELPVLVVGMMRSGTTLVEQILSSHPRVAAGGELKFWPDHDILDFDATDCRRNAARAGGVINDYLEHLARFGPDAARVTDKLPQNFMHLGLIHTLFPKAKIVHCRRNPVDNCLSIFVTPMRDTLEYGHDRANIVFAYRQYLNIMDHWRRVLPSGCLLDIDYEDLVADHEVSARRLVEFCGLDWDDRCLRHESNTRVVNTASIWQARQPIYRTSVARWRKYEPWLGAFRDLLEEQDRTAA